MGEKDPRKPLNLVERGTFGGKAAEMIQVRICSLRETIKSFNRWNEIVFSKKRDDFLRCHLCGFRGEKEGEEGGGGFWKEVSRSCWKPLMKGVITGINLGTFIKRKKQKRKKKKKNPKEELRPRGIETGSLTKNPASMKKRSFTRLG